ncbi:MULTISPECIES: adenine nucleotide alpha hydrolase [unclassified Anaeromyxobacter]|uniref:adenine nucleotide alpha hydrolase n=1 Tax=unclassified Anaeromyxobacter TaxID=2620896 RepID=UPI001F5763EF|nr:MULTISPECIES: adenine nucleotide alpha hydrolase [unclassified Anaeromyxobacter]
MSIPAGGRTPTRPKAIVSWSSGKDSAWALHLVRARGDLEIVGLLTTVTAEFSRVAMHAVRETLLDAQSQALGLPCRKVKLPWPCSNEVYEREMTEALSAARAAGVTHVVFGDLFLRDIRAYREARLAGTGLSPVFPLWDRDTRALAGEMIDAGLRATLTCVDPRVLDARFAGRAFDGALLAELPSTVDPCGENGEFHTFAWAGPMFETPIPVAAGEVVERDGFTFADLLPRPAGDPAAQR